MSGRRPPLAEPNPTMLQTTAKRISGFFGRESWMVRSARPAYESMLDLVYRRNGMPWVINGADYRIDPHQRHRLGELYDSTVADFLRSRVRSGQTCFDIGANVGVYVLQFANWLRSGRVVAFEPNPGARKVLEYHLRINGISDRVAVVPSAVGKTSGSATRYAAGADGMSRLNAPNTAIADKVSALDVSIVSIDDYISQSGITPDILMIDVEGFEIAAIAGAKRLIKETGFVDRRRNASQRLVIGGHHSEVCRRPAGRASTNPDSLQGQSHPLDDHAIVPLKQR